jgi:hypothetical protein
VGRKKLITGVVLLAALGTGIYFVYERWMRSRGEERESLLGALPADATAVIYLDVAELRQGEILKGISNWSTGAVTDPEYKQFVSETGFDYERNLDRVGIAVENRGGARNYFALADGSFDRGKIEAYLRKNAVSTKKGPLEIFHFAAPNSNPYISSVRHWISIAFLSDRRLALTGAADLSSELEAAKTKAGHAEWMGRFERLAGTPVFALIRQDAAIGALLNNQAPGGLRSPQLGQLLNQLLWVSIAGKPEGKEFRAVIEGECPNEMTMRQLSDFLNGITLMANAGLNDPKLRQQMDPEEREAYLQLLNSMDVMRLDRGTSKSVRVTFVVTPEIWGKLALAAREKPQEEADPANTKANPSLNKRKNGGQKQTARRP